MPKKLSPIQSQFNFINDEFEVLNTQLVKRIELFGDSPEDIEQAFRLVRYEERFLETSLIATLAATEIAAGKKLADVNRARQYYLRHKWPDGLNLSQRVVKGTKENIKIVKQEVSRSIKAINAWNKTAKNITDTQLIKGDIAGHIWEVIKHGRRNLRDTATTAKLYERAVRKSQNYIERLASNGAPTQRLKKAYQAVIKATESGSKTAIRSAYDRAVKEKANYNAQRIARTETARAYGNGFFAEIADDDLIVGYRSVLSVNHPQVDICDMYAESNFYGMGPGIYPKNRGPAYPYHPHCRCNLEPVTFYGGKRTGFKKEAGIKYLKDHPIKAQKILGKGRYQQKDSLKKWDKITPNYNGMEKHNAELPKNFFKE